MRNGPKFLLCFITGLTTGVLIGIGVFTLVVSYKIDMYYTRIAYMEKEIQEKDVRLEKLEESINTQKYILKEIEVILNFNGDEEDEIDKIDIEKHIKEKYTTLLGKEIKNIDADITAEVIDNRIFKFEDREYKLHVSKLVLTEILKIWINVETISNI